MKADPIIKEAVLDHFNKGLTCSQSAQLIPGMNRHKVKGHRERMGLKGTASSTVQGPPIVVNQQVVLVETPPKSKVGVQYKGTHILTPFKNPPPTARHWETRGSGECKWPYEGGLSCCEKRSPGSKHYCAYHHALSIDNRQRRHR